MHLSSIHRKLKSRHIVDMIFINIRNQFDEIVEGNSFIRATYLILPIKLFEFILVNYRLEPI